MISFCVDFIQVIWRYDVRRPFKN